MMDSVCRLEERVFIGHCASSHSFAESRPEELIVEAEGKVQWIKEVREKGRGVPGA